ncbi:hypothetical protein AC579_4136 [Pseudocercospora musae]|uniref:SnoaL-like domain-containing protein n=1 Tax=Pseudocercospora musae TaxID=113226 RepID=A0A139IE42_9PEZI|nr:hypothetical protein AC579_4136 [Pseudocercospora musae]
MSIADVDAVNNRDWGPSSALFQNKATYWEASTTAALSVRKLSVQGFVDSIKKKVEMCPDFKLRIIDFTTTVNEGKGRAEIFANMEVTGDWSGVAQRNVTHLEYHLIEGKWLHAERTGLEFPEECGTGGMSTIRTRIRAVQHLCRSAQMLVASKWHRCPVAAKGALEKIKNERDEDHRHG